MASALLLTLLIWLHILAVVVWIGGAIFLIYIFSPNMTLLQPPDAGKLGGAVGKKFTTIVWGSVVVVAVTGILRMALSGLLNINILLGTTYGRAILLKLILFTGMIIAGGMIGKTEKELATATSPEEAMKSKKKMATLGKIVIALGIIVTFLGVGLNYGAF